MARRFAPEERVALIAGAVAAGGVLAVLIAGKVAELGTPERTAAIEAEVTRIAEETVMYHLLTSYGLTPQRVATLERFGRSFAR